MNQAKTCRTNSLSHVLQIGKEPTLGTEEALAFEDGFFDEQKNFVINNSVFWPWEWVTIPEIVELAKRRGVEIPENPNVDLSRTF